MSPLGCRIDCQHRPVFRRRHDDQSRHRHRRGHEPQRGVIVARRIQAAAAEDLLPVGKPMGHDAIAAVRQQERPLRVAIDHRRGVRLLALFAGVGRSRLTPDFVPRGGVQGHNRRAAAVQQLQVQPAVVEDRRRRHAELNVELAILVLHVVLPDLFAIDRVTGQFPRPHEGPHVPAVGRRRGRGEVAFIAAHRAIVARNLTLPKQLAVGADRHQHERVPLGRSQKDLLVPNHRCRSGRPGQRQPPQHSPRLRSSWSASRSRD